MSYTAEQLRHLREMAFNAVQFGHQEQNYWAEVALQLIDTLEKEREEWCRERGI